MVMLHALGHCLIRTGIATIGPRAELGFALATRLIADRGRRFSRRYLTALFWPDVEEQKAAHSLSEAFHRLRSRGVPIQSDSTQAVWIEKGDAMLDVERIPEMAPADLAKCDFAVLPGFEPRGAPALLDWADEFRHQVTIKTVRSLAPAIARAEREGDWETALTLAEHVLKLDGDDAVALDARARAAQSLRALHTPRAAATRSDARPERVRETAPPVCGSRPQPPRDIAPGGAFVGRESELGIMLDVWDQTIAGRGTCIRIVGPSGIGKSRLLREFSSKARAKGGVIAEAACDPPDQRKPMSTLMRLVPRLRRLPGAAGCAPEFVPYLDRLTEYDAGSGQLPNAADIPYLATCVERAVAELVDAVCEEQPLVIALDNAQWMDSDSMRLLEALSLRAPTQPVLIILVSCDGAQLEAAHHCVDAVPIRLAPLCDEAARALVQGLTTDHRTAPDALIDWFVRAGEGHPLWLTELVQHWIATGAAFSVPPTLAALLKERVSRLTLLQRHVLQIVALLGHTATLKRVERIASVEPSALLDALDTLGTSGFLIVDRMAAEGTPELACRHDAIASAALSQLAPPAQAWLHRQIARMLDDDSTTSGSAELLWDRAAHWSAGERADRVVDTGLACVRHLLDIGLSDAAISACKDLSARCVDAPSSVAIRRTLAEILHLTRRWDEFRDVLRSIDSPAHAHDGLELLALDAEWQCRRDWRATLTSALQCAEATDAPDSHRLRAAVLALKVATNLADSAAVRRAHDAVAQIISSNATPSGDALVFQMIHASVDGCDDDAVRHARTLLESVAQTRCPNRLRLMLNCAAALGRAGAVAEARQVCEEVYATAPRSALPALSLDACRRGALIMLDHGRFHNARQWLDRMMSDSTLRIPPPQQGLIAVIRAKLALFDGECRQALGLLEGQRRTSRADCIPMFDAAVLAVQLLAKIKQGAEPADLVAEVESLRRLWERLVPFGNQDYEAVAVVAGFAYIGREEMARSTLERYLERVRRDRYPLPPTFRVMLEDCVPVATG